MMYQGQTVERRIEPAIEPDFSLGAWEVRPASLELIRDGKPRGIEKRMMQVLVALHRWSGEVLTRHQLYDLCWDGRIVGEDALNRVISRLRKLFEDDPQIVIETIPRIGYRLRTEDSEAPPPLEKGSRKRGYLISGGLILLVALALYASVYLGKDEWRLDALRPLTREQGVELSPSLSADGRWLAYSAGGGFGAPLDIYIREVGSGMAPPVRLTSTRANETSPVWSPDNRKLAFVRTAEGRPCQIIVTTPPNGFEQNIGSCSNENSTELAWLDDHRLAFADRRSGSVRRIFAVDTRTGRVTPLTDPPAGSSDALPSLSTDGRKLAFVRSRAPGDQQLLTMDLASGKIEPVTGAGWKISGAAWTPKSDAVVFSSNREGDFGLWITRGGKGGEPERLAPGILPFGRLSIDRHGHVAVDSSRKQVNLAEVGGSGEPRMLTSSGQDWDPDLSRSGDLLFGSDRSGSNEIWKMAPGAPPQQLTNRRSGFAYSPRWSPSGRLIAYLLSSPGGSDLILMNADGARARLAVRDRGNKGSLAWLTNDKLLFTSEVEGRWQLTELDVRDGRVRAVPGSEGMTVLRPAPDGSVFGARLDRSIWRVAMRQGAPFLERTSLSVDDAEQWAPATGGILVLEQRPGAPARIVSLTGPRRTVIATLPPVHRPTFTSSNSAGVVIPRLVDDQADIIGFRLKSR